MNAKVHRVKGNQLTRRYRLIPYDNLTDVLKKDGVAFLEGPFKRQTVWRAARTLTEMTKSEVIAERCFYTMKNGSQLEGYAFSVKQQKPHKK